MQVKRQLFYKNIAAQQRNSIKSEIRDSLIKNM